MIKLFGLLLFLLILNCGEKDHSDAHAFAREHYDIKEFFQYYEDFYIHFGDSTDLVFIFGYDSLSLYNKYWDSTEFSEDDFYRDISSNCFVQGWDDCEPVFNSNGGYILDSSIYTYFYMYYSTDTTWLLNIYSKFDSSLLNTGVMGYSQNYYIYNQMLSE